MSQVCLEYLSYIDVREIRSDPKIEGRIPTGEISMLKEVDVAMLYRLPLLGIIKTILSPQSFYIPRVLARFFM